MAFSEHKHIPIDIQSSAAAQQRRCEPSKGFASKSGESQRKGQRANQREAEKARESQRGPERARKGQRAREGQRKQDHFGGGAPSISDVFLSAADKTTNIYLYKCFKVVWIP